MSNLDRIRQAIDLIRTLIRESGFSELDEALTFEAPPEMGENNDQEVSDSFSELNSEMKLEAFLWTYIHQATRHLFHLRVETSRSVLDDLNEILEDHIENLELVVSSRSFDLLDEHTYGMALQTRTALIRISEILKRGDPEGSTFETTQDPPPDPTGDPSALARAEQRRKSMLQQYFLAKQAAALHKFRSD